MKVAVCGCLLGHNCKYNGKNNRNEQLLTFLQDKEIFSLCPEAMAMLPIPRPPIEWLGDRAVNSTGHDYTAEFVLGAQRAMSLVKQIEPEMVILQPRSPSCGVGQIYDGTFTKTLVPGNGDFAALLLAHGYQISREQLSDKFIILNKS